MKSHTGPALGSTPPLQVGQAHLHVQSRRRLLRWRGLELHRNGGTRSHLDHPAGRRRRRGLRALLQADPIAQHVGLDAALERHLGQRHARPQACLGQFALGLPVVNSAPVALVADDYD